jgi:hypothetical protein
MIVPYCTREDVMSALDVKESARIRTQIDRATRGASETIENDLARSFYPVITTIYKDWPNSQYARPWRLWLDAQELISVTSIASGGNVLVNPSSPTARDGDYFLGPTDGDTRYSPPYTYIEMSLAVSKSFTAGAGTWQGSIVINGLAGYRNDEVAGGALNGGINASVTVLNVTDSSVIGTGSLIRIDNERMLVTARAMLSSGQTLQAPIDASVATVIVGVTDGTKFAVGETILLDAERMQIVDIAGNNLIVKRGTDGTVLAAHTGSTVYAPRTLTVQRAFGGTTATTHADTTAINVWQPPPLVNEVAVAESINTVMQETSGYARTVGSGDNVRNASGAGLAALWSKVRNAHARQARSRVV